MLNEAKHPYFGFLTAFGMTKHKCATVPQNQHWQL
jgi:hypothetical protein